MRGTVESNLAIVVGLVESQKQQLLQSELHSLQLEVEISIYCLKQPELKIFSMKKKKVQPHHLPQTSGSMGVKAPEKQGREGV